jgi:hypothetical protein
LQSLSKTQHFWCGIPLIIRSSKLYLQLWFIYPCDDRPLSRLSGKWMSLELLMMSGVPLEIFWAFNKLWNNKFYYKLHLVGISTEAYYDARIHECQISIYLGKRYSENIEWRVDKMQCFGILKRILHKITTEFWSVK